MIRHVSYRVGLNWKLELQDSIFHSRHCHVLYILSLAGSWGSTSTRRTSIVFRAPPFPSHQNSRSPLALDSLDTMDSRVHGTAEAMAFTSRR